MIPFSDWLKIATGPMAARNDSCNPGLCDQTDTCAPADLRDDSGREFELSQAREEGLRVGRESVLKEYEGAIAELRRQSADDLQKARDKWQLDEVSSLALTLTESLHELRASLEENVADVLRPFLEEQCRLKAVKSFGDVLMEHIELRLSPIVSVSVPETLLDDLRAALSARGISIELTAAKGMEAEAVTGEGCFSTCLREWLDMVDEASHV